MMESNDDAGEFLRGAIDMHVHSGPDVFPRAFNDLDVACDAKAHEMRAVVLKSHVTATPDRAQIAAKVSGFMLFGGIALNHEVGGLNPAAVNAALRLGARVVWMPTFNSVAHVRESNSIPRLKQFFLPGTKGINLLSRGVLKKGIGDILGLIKEHDALLATGHVSVKEAKALVQGAKAHGIRKIIVTHPIGGHNSFSNEDLLQLAELGAYIEHCWVFTTSFVKHQVKPKVFAAVIKAVGPARTILSSDSGQAGSPLPTQMLGDFCSNMLKFGIAKRDIRMMVSDNPARLLGL